MRGDFKIQFGEPKYKRKQERLQNKKHRRERSAKNYHDKSNRLMVFDLKILVAQNAKVSI